MVKRINTNINVQCGKRNTTGANGLMRGPSSTGGKLIISIVDNFAILLMYVLVGFVGV